VRVLITGGGGFLGGVLASRLLSLGALTGSSGAPEPIDSLVLFDVAHRPGDAGADPRVNRVTGNVGDREQLRHIVDSGDLAVFHLASMVSAGCEADFDGALAVNLEGTRAVLEACRATGSLPRVVFTSSIAAFGGEGAKATVTDTTKLTPETTYGVTKAICELLVNDYTRKGFLDGRSARLPTVVIRPGRPNAAASSWVSGLFREPLAGEEGVVPVDPGTRVPICSYRVVVENLIKLYEADGMTLGADRALNLPAIAVTPQEMIDGLRTATTRPLGPISFRIDPTIDGMFATWAQHSSFERATSLGMEADEGVEEIVHAYVEDYLPS
jgi:D-erythronate 2-dehydrogenase